jgi:hypothetical protein
MVSAMLAPLVALVEGFACDDDIVDLAAADRHGALEAPSIQHEADMPRSMVGRERCKDRIGISHLRHTLGIDETGHLEPADPCRLRRCDQGQLVGGGKQHRLVLDAIAR